MGAGMKKWEIKRVLNGAVNALDGAHVVTGGPKGDSGDWTGMDAREVVETVAFIVVLIAVMLVLGVVL